MRAFEINHRGESERHDLEIEPFGGGAELEGWLIRYAPGLAIWCGEISRETFCGYTRDVRSAMRDDCGWYLIEIDTRATLEPATRLLAKLASEVLGLELAIAVAIGLRAQRRAYPAD